MEELRVKENALPTTSLTRVEHYIATYSTKTNLRRTLKDVIYQEGVYGLIVQIGCIYWRDAYGVILILDNVFIVNELSGERGKLTGKHFPEKLKPTIKVFAKQGWPILLGTKSKKVDE